MTTIRDIAREAGVSVSTVSRVLADHPDVGAETAERVRAVIDRRQFVVNLHARDLKRGLTTTVLIVVRGRHNVLFTAMLGDLQAAVERAGLTVAIHYVDEDGNEMTEAERLVAEVRARGVILLGANMDNLARGSRLLGRACPVVVVTSPLPGAGHPGFSAATTDDRAAAGLAIDHLVAHGHRCIGVVGGDPDISTTSRLRRLGALEAMTRHGLRFDPESAYVRTRYGLDEAYEATGRLLDARPDLTAIYGMNDLVAIGVMRALYDRGIGVPDDMSLIGHDGVQLAAFHTPAIASIRQPRRDLAEQGVTLLVRHLAGNLTPEVRILPVDLIPGETVRTISAE